MRERYVRLIPRVSISILLTLIFIAPLCAQKPDRSKPPELGPPPSLKLPPIRHFELSNGLPVILLEKHEVPLVQVNLMVKGGATSDPASKSGLANMTARMLTEGAGTRNALQLADAIDYLGATLTAGAGFHTTVVELHTPLSKLDSALALMADVALRPMFPSEELERVRKERLTTLVQWHDEPRSIASVLFNKTLYGMKHPYGLPNIGNEQSLRSFTTQDLKDFHASHFSASNASLIVVGDVTLNSIRQKLEKAFGEMRPGKGEKVSLPSVQQIQKREIYLVDKLGAAQTEVRIGRIGVPRLTDDYYSILVLNTILGGSFTSRLNQNLREQHGYSYGAGSQFDFRPEAGPFLAGAAVQTAVTDKALAEFMKELNAILEPVSEEELTRAKNYLALRYPGAFETVAQVAGQLSELVLYRLPDDYFNQYVEKILAVTKENVQTVAKKYIDPEKVAIILVGDRKQIEQGVSALNLGSIQPLTIEDVLGKMPEVSGQQ